MKWVWPYSGGGVYRRGSNLLHTMVLLIIKIQSKLLKTGKRNSENRGKGKYDVLIY